jgi:hypothetical protein
MKNTQKGARYKSQPNNHQHSRVFSEYFCSEMPGSSPAFRRNREPKGQLNHTQLPQLSGETVKPKTNSPTRNKAQLSEDKT